MFKWPDLPSARAAEHELADFAELVCWKYRIVSPTDLSRMGVAFMRMNALVSATMLLSTLTAVLVDWGSTW